MTKSAHTDSRIATREWLYPLTLDESTFWEGRSAPPQTKNEIEEMQEALSEVSDEDFDEAWSKRQRIDGWSGLLLDDVGYEDVKEKKKWIAEVEEPGYFVNSLV